MSSAYTTKALMERRFSALGISAYADMSDVGVATSGVVDDAIAMASEEIDLWLRSRYDPALLATSELIQRWATELSCFYLCQVRGLDPPSSLLAFYDRLTKERTGYLWRLQKGLMQLPGIPVNGDLRPSMSNLKIDRRWRHSKVRVTPANSTDAPTRLSQDTDMDAPAIYD